MKRRRFKQDEALRLIREARLARERVKQLSGDREDLLKEAREAEIVAQLDDEIVARLHRWLTSRGLKLPI
jgi:hypothetical protein